MGAANSKHHLTLPEASGPRHLDFHPTRPWVYVLCELDGNIVGCEWDAEAGLLTPFGSYYTLPDGLAPCRAHHSGGSHVLVSADGNCLYASTRTDGAIVAFNIDAASGALTFKQRVPCGGVCPRNFVLDYSSAGAALLRGLA